MAEIILVRHGQANSKARDAESYDRLSALGRQQAGWLGDWLRDSNPRFDRVVSGQLKRQRDTAIGMGYGATLEVDARWDELDYFGLSQAMEAEHGLPFPDKPDDFPEHAPQLFDAWKAGRIEGAPETFDHFQTRVVDALTEAGATGRRTLIVTSAGVIGAVMRMLLGLDTRAWVKLVLHTCNSSMHRVEMLDHGNFVDGFNATPHLDHPDRAHARTYI
jgi:broad specificity phosphatase PhoE